MTKLNSEFVVPNQEDYIGAMTSIVRLQETFKLSTAQIRSGVFENSKSYRPLNGKTLNFSYKIMAKIFLICY